MMIIALDAAYTGIDRINTLGISYKNNSGDTVCKLIEDYSKEKEDRGISVELFQKLKRDHLNRSSKITLLTWGGPERIALLHHIKNFKMWHIRVIDMERIADIIFPCSSLNKVSKLLGTKAKKDKCPSKDANAILEIHEHLQYMTKAAAYAVDPFRYSYFMESREQRKYYQRHNLRRAGLGRMVECIDSLNADLENAEEKELWYFNYRLNLSDRYLKQLNNSMYRDSELHCVSLYRLRGKDLLTRTQSLKRFISVSIDQSDQCVDGLLLTDKAKREREIGRNDAVFYMSMYKPANKELFTERPQTVGK